MLYNIKKDDHEYIVKDTVQGDNESSSLLDDISWEEIQEALNLIYSRSDLTDLKKAELVANLWRINYKIKPPTVEEFLTPQYIGGTAETLYPHVKQVIKEFMNPLGQKRILALSCHIGYGKSSISVLIILYIIVLLEYMRNPKKYFGFSQMGSIGATFFSFTQKKTEQVLVRPFKNLLRESPIFHSTKYEHSLKKKQKDIDTGHIAYTTAGKYGEVQTASDIHVVKMSNINDLLGLNLFAGIMSEISFWGEAGFSSEEIWRAFIKLRGRIFSRMGNPYLSSIILDSSPLDMEISPIDKWLFTGEYTRDKSVLFVNNKHWETFKDLKPEIYEKWLKTKETFKVYRGNSANPPKLLNKAENLKKYNSEDIIDVPIDLYDISYEGIKDFVRDYCAWPSGGINKLFDRYQDIENIFTTNLRNQYDPINIPEEKEPKKLIWNQIVNTFFINLGTREKPNYQFWRNPNAERVISIDLSEIGDISSLSMSHVELNLSGDIIIIHDFTLPLYKGKSRINIDAVCEFILDLAKIGHINIWKITADQYQSASILSRLRRNGFEAEKYSVDRETAQYLLYASLIKTGKVKAGKNIHLKNNLKSLMETRTDKGKSKIDHIAGKPTYSDSGNWKTSQVGFKAKDVSDSACANASLLLTEYKKKPMYIFDDTVNINDPEEQKKKLLTNLGLKNFLIPSN